MTNKYKNYKSSGVKWLGDIPDSWSSVSLKRILIGIKDGTHGTHERVNEEEGVPLLSAKNIKNYKLILGQNESFISNEEHEKIIKNGYPKKKDLLFSCVGSIGESYIYDYEYPISFQRSVAFLRFKRNNDSRYFKYFFNSTFFKREILASIKTTAQSGIYLGAIKEIFVLIPDFLEQTEIANYLDEKTSSIDNSIEILKLQKERLIEQKKAIIHKAVTKGLDDSVKMKDSGVEWIGEIPKNWEIKKLKSLFSFQMGNTILKESLNKNKKGIPVYSATKEDKYFGYLENPNFLLNVGDIVFGARGTIGKPKIVKEIVTCTQTTIACKKKKKTNSNYVYYFMDGLHESVFDFSKTAMPQFTIENAKSISITIPDNNEQYEIVKYLDEKTFKIEEAVNEVEKQISLLEEYKKTLINDVVTGKIKVF